MVFFLKKILFFIFLNNYNLNSPDNLQVNPYSPRRISWAVEPPTASYKYARYPWSVLKKQLQTWLNGQIIGPKQKSKKSVAQYIDPDSVKLGFQYIITAVIYSLRLSQPVRTLEAATGEETQERSSSAELLRNLYVSKMVSLSFSLLFMLLAFELSAFWFCFWIR